MNYLFESSLNKNSLSLSLSQMSFKLYHKLIPLSSLKFSSLFAGFVLREIFLREVLKFQQFFHRHRQESVNFVKLFFFSLR